MRTKNEHKALKNLVHRKQRLDYMELFCKDCFESCPYYKIHG